MQNFTVSVDVCEEDITVFEFRVAVLCHVVLYQVVFPYTALLKITFCMSQPNVLQISQILLRC